MTDGSADAITGARRRRPRGAVRDGLIAAGLELARAGGPDAVVLREAARMVGVVPNAAYRHFADRDELLAAVCTAAMGEFAHGRGGDRGQELVPVGEVPVGGVRHHAHHLCRLAEHDGIRAAGPGQFQPDGDQAVADGTARAAPPGPGYLAR